MRAIKNMQKTKILEYFDLLCTLLCRPVQVLEVAKFFRIDYHKKARYSSDYTWLANCFVHKPLFKQTKQNAEGLKLKRQLIFF